MTWPSGKIEKIVYDECKLHYVYPGYEGFGALYRCDEGVFFCIAADLGLKIVAPRLKGGGGQGGLIDMTLDSGEKVKELDVDDQGCQKYSLEFDSPSSNVDHIFYNVCPGRGVTNIKAFGVSGSTLFEQSLISNQGLLSDVATY